MCGGRLRVPAAAPPRSCGSLHARRSRHELPTHVLPRFSTLPPPRSSLSAKCRKEELTLSQLQAKDVRLRPRLMKLCGEEMVVFCKDTAPGAGRMFNCLLENVQKTGFSAQCRDEVVKREDLMKGDYRLDGGVAANCKDDVAAHCAAEAAGAHGHAEVLKCLVAKIMQPAAAVSDACQTEISR